MYASICSMQLFKNCNEALKYRNENELYLTFLINLDTELNHLHIHKTWGKAHL